MSRMRVRNFFLCNYAETKESLTYISGAFPEWWTVPQFPATATIYAVGLLEFEDDERETPFKLSVLLRRPEGDAILILTTSATRGVQETDVPGAPRHQALIDVSAIEVLGPGLHEFILQIEDTEEASAAVMLRVEPAQLHAPQG